MKPRLNRIYKGNGIPIFALLLCLLIPDTQAQKLDMSPLPNSNLAKMNILLMDSWKSGPHGQSAQIAKSAMENFQQEIGFKMTYSKKGSDLNLNYLKNFNILIFNYSPPTTGNVNAAQRKDVEEYIKGGGHWIGFHTAAFPRKGDWDWYRDNLIIGSYNPNYHGTQRGKMVKTSDPEVRKHPILTKMPESFTGSDEWYAFNQGPKFDQAKVTYYVDESSMKAHSHKHLDPAQLDLPVEIRHPLSWFYEDPVTKSRVFFSGIIHDPASADTDFFKLTILRAMEFCAGIIETPGCPDTSYVEYKADRTRDDSSLCKTKKPTWINKISARETGASLNSFLLSINRRGPHTVAIHDISGALVQRFSGNGTSHYNLSAMLPSGIYYLQVQTQGKSSSHRVFLY